VTLSWFKFYVEAIDDQKLWCRPPAERWLWTVLMAMARRSPEPGVLLIGPGVAATDEHWRDYQDVVGLWSTGVPRPNCDSCDNRGWVEDDAGDMRPCQDCNEL
jgi:hypothetical protein